MSKTAREWVDDPATVNAPCLTVAMVQAIIDDARAGMVPEATVVRPIDIVFDGPPSHEAGRFVEVEDMDGRSIKVGEWIDRGDGFWALRLGLPSLEAELAKRDAALADLAAKQDSIERLEAELAKAWEAGRDAAAEMVEARDSAGPEEFWSDAATEIRALQPPGGKAKTCGVDLVWMRPGNRPGGFVPCNRPVGHEGEHQALMNQPPGGKAKCTCAPDVVMPSTFGHATTCALYEGDERAKP